MSLLGQEGLTSLSSMMVMMPPSSFVVMVMVIVLVVVWLLLLMVGAQAKGRDDHAALVAGLSGDLEDAGVLGAGDAAGLFGRHFDFAPVIVDLRVEVAHDGHVSFFPFFVFGR